MLIQRMPQTTTRLIKLPLEIPTTPTKPLLTKGTWEKKCQWTRHHPYTHSLTWPVGVVACQVMGDEVVPAEPQDVKCQEERILIAPRIAHLWKHMMLNVQSINLRQSLWTNIYVGSLALFLNQWQTVDIYVGSLSVSLTQWQTVEIYVKTFATLFKPMSLICK